MSLRKILRNINDEKLWDEYAWLTAIAQPVHHGMLFVPIGYTFSAGMFEMEELKGGSPYGSVVQKLMLVMVQDTQLSLSWSKHSTKASTSPTSQRSWRKQHNADSIFLKTIHYILVPECVEFRFLGACIACNSLFIFQKEMFCIVLYWV